MYNGILSRVTLSAKSIANFKLFSHKDNEIWIGNKSEVSPQLLKKEWVKLEKAPKDVGGYLLTLTFDGYTKWLAWKCASSIK